MAKYENGIVKEKNLIMNDLTMNHNGILKLGYVEKRSQYLKKWNM